MSSALNERKNEIQRGMQGLCDAVGNFARVRDALEELLPTAAPGSECEADLLKVSRVCDHLVQAVADLPEQCWQILAENAIGGEEFRARILQAVQGKAVAA